MAWRRIGDKPLSEPMLTLFTDAYKYIRHQGEMSFNTLKPDQSSRHFADIFKGVYFNKNDGILIQISITFDPATSIPNWR